MFSYLQLAVTLYIGSSVRLNAACNWHKGFEQEEHLGNEHTKNTPLILMCAARDLRYGPFLCFLDPWWLIEPHDENFK
jgi:hypothetical protein